MPAAWAANLGKGSGRQQSPRRRGADGPQKRAPSGSPRGRQARGSPDPLPTQGRGVSPSAQPGRRGSSSPRPQEERKGSSSPRRRGGAAGQPPRAAPGESTPAAAPAATPASVPAGSIPAGSCSVSTVDETAGLPLLDTPEINVMRVQVDTPAGCGCFMRDAGRPAVRYELNGVPQATGRVLLWMPLGGGEDHAGSITIPGAGVDIPLKVVKLREQLGGLRHIAKQAGIETNIGDRVRVRDEILAAVAAADLERRRPAPAPAPAPQAADPAPAPVRPAPQVVHGSPPPGPPPPAAPRGGEHAAHPIHQIPVSMPWSESQGSSGSEAPSPTAGAGDGRSIVCGVPVGRSGSGCSAADLPPPAAAGRFPEAACSGRGGAVVFLPIGEVAAAVRRRLWDPPAARAQLLALGLPAEAPPGGASSLQPEQLRRFGPFLEKLCAAVGVLCIVTADGEGAEAPGCTEEAALAERIAAALAASPACSSGVSFTPAEQAQLGACYGLIDRADSVPAAAEPDHETVPCVRPRAQPQAEPPRAAPPRGLYLGAGAAQQAARAGGPQLAAVHWTVLTLLGGSDDEAAALLKDTAPSQGPPQRDVQRVLYRMRCNGEDARVAEYCRSRCASWFADCGTESLSGLPEWHDSVTAALLPLLRSRQLVPRHAAALLERLRAPPGPLCLAWLWSTGAEAEWRCHVLRAVGACMRDGIGEGAADAARLLIGLGALTPRAGEDADDAASGALRLHELGLARVAVTPASPAGAYRFSLGASGGALLHSVVAALRHATQCCRFIGGAPDPRHRSCAATALAALLTLEGLQQSGQLSEFLLATTAGGDEEAVADAEALPAALLGLYEATTRGGADELGAWAPAAVPFAFSCARLLTFAWGYFSSPTPALVGALVRGLAEGPCHWRLLETVPLCVAHMVSRSGGLRRTAAAARGAVELLLHRTAEGAEESGGEHRRLRAKSCAALCALCACSPLFCEWLDDALDLTGVALRGSVAAALAAADHRQLDEALRRAWAQQPGGPRRAASELRIEMRRLGLPAPTPPSPLFDGAFPMPRDEEAVPPLPRRRAPDPAALEADSFAPSPGAAHPAPMTPPQAPVAASRGADCAAAAGVVCPAMG